MKLLMYSIFPVEKGHLATDFNVKMWTQLNIKLDFENRYLPHHFMFFLFVIIYFFVFFRFLIFKMKTDGSTELSTILCTTKPTIWYQALSFLDLCCLLVLKRWLWEFFWWWVKCRCLYLDSRKVQILKRTFYVLTHVFINMLNLTNSILFSACFGKYLILYVCIQCLI